MEFKNLVRTNGNIRNIRVYLGVYLKLYNFWRQIFIRENRSWIGQILFKDVFLFVNNSKHKQIASWMILSFFPSFYRAENRACKKGLSTLFYFRAGFKVVT